MLHPHHGELGLREGGDSSIYPGRPGSEGHYAIELLVKPHQSLRVVSG